MASRSRSQRSRLTGALAAILVTGVLASCTGSATPAADGPTTEPSSVTAVDARNIHALTTTPRPVLPVTVRSADGATVHVTDVSRIVPLTGSIAEVVFSLNLGSHAVGRDVATTFTQAAKLPVVTRGHDVSAESVLSLRPTLVLADADTGPPEAISQIRAAGVPVVVVPVATSVADVAPRIHAVADALGVSAAGDELATRTTDEIASATADVHPERRPSVAFLYLRGSAGVYLIGGKGSGADSLITAAGGTDAGSALHLKSFTPITSEALIAAAPDVLLLMSDGLKSVGGLNGLEKVPGIAQTPAGENRRVITIEDGVLLNFGPRTAEVITALADALRAAG